MRRALATDFSALQGVRVLMTLDERFPDEPGPWTTIRVFPGQETQVLATWAAAADHTLVVAPETGGILRARAEILERAGGHSLGPSMEAIEQTSRKDLLGEHWQKQGVETPPMIPWPADRQSGQYLSGFDRNAPMVLKPSDGAGSLETFFVESLDQIPEAARGILNALLQPFVPGVPMSASFLCGADGTAKLVGVGRQRVLCRGGRFEYRGGIVPAPEHLGGCPAEVLRAVAVVPGLRGWVGVDYILEDSTGRPVLLEINPRVTTSYVGLRRLLPTGILAKAWLDLFDPARPVAPLDLAEHVDRSHPLAFDADGSIVDEGVDP